MANFTAKTKAEIEGVAEGAKPGDKSPEAEPGGFAYMGDGGFYIYKHDKHSERDCLRPGYFDGVIQKNAGQYGGA